jgi:hypothetical protein
MSSELNASTPSRRRWNTSQPRSASTHQISLRIYVREYEELVESTFALGLENAFRDALNGLIVRGNKARHVGFRVMFLVMREATELIDEIGTGQKPP